MRELPNLPTSPRRGTPRPGRRTEPRSAEARASFNVYTNEADTDAPIAGLNEVKRIFGRA
jgi:selenocysteine lyase/cysteine desulfurase